MEDGQRRRRAPGDDHIDRDLIGDAPRGRKTRPKDPPEMAQAPIATTRFGVGIAS